MTEAPDTITVDAPSGPLPADRWPGAGPPIVLLHAGVADRRAWHGVAPLLAAAGHEVIAYDRRGFGDAAGAPADPGFTHLGDLVAVLDAVGADSAWLVGSSMGGLLALDLALSEPARVAGLVLLAPGVSGAPYDEELDPATAALIARLEAAENPEEVNRLETWLWLDGPDREEGRVSGPARELALAMNAVALASEVDDDAGGSDIAAWERLEEITAPVMVAWGEFDVPMEIDYARAIAKRVAGARSEEIPGAAHLPYLERPEAVADLIERALRDR